MELSGLSMAIANSSLGANISMETVVPTSPDLGQYIDIRV